VSDKHEGISLRSDDEYTRRRPELQQRLVVFPASILYLVAALFYQKQSNPTEAQMAVKTSTVQGGIGVIEVKGSLVGGEETDELRRAVAGFVDRNYDKLIIDLSGVTYVNSTAIAVLVSAHTTYTKKGWRVKLCGINKSINSVFVITKLALVFDVYDTMKEAIKSFA
jgi:anti-sigma B factor antagonist